MNSLAFWTGFCSTGLWLGCLATAVWLSVKRKPKLSIFILVCGCVFYSVVLLRAQEPAPLKPDELQQLRARITILEQKLQATEQKSRACFEIYQADMTLNQIVQQQSASKEKQGRDR